MARRTWTGEEKLVVVDDQPAYMPIGLHHRRVDRAVGAGARRFEDGPHYSGDTLLTSRDGSYVLCHRNSRRDDFEKPEPVPIFPYFPCLPATVERSDGTILVPGASQSDFNGLLDEFREWC